MRYVTIPNTDLRVSQICLGTTQMGAGIAPPDATALLDVFVARGGNFIDTAHVYSNWIPGTKSRSEKHIGQWLRERGNRGEIVLSTKGAHPETDTMNVSRLSRAEIEQDLTESLEFLGIDTVDLYWLHRDDPAIPVGEIVDVLSEQVDAGRIRYFGASNWSVARIQAALDYSARRGIPSFVANQPQWSLAVADMARAQDKTTIALDDDGVAFHRRTGMALMPYSSQAQGFFSKLDEQGGAGIEKPGLAVYDHETNWKRLARVQTVARRNGVPVNDVVLAYTLSQPFTTIPIVGPKNVDHLLSSLNALDLTLTADELAYLERG